MGAAPVHVAGSQVQHINVSVKICGFRAARGAACGVREGVIATAHASIGCFCVMTCQAECSNGAETQGVHSIDNKGAISNFVRMHAACMVCATC